VGIAATGRDAVSLASSLQPDIVIMDHSMPEMNGTEAARAIRARLPEVKIVILSMHSNAIHAYRALQAGAAGYVVKWEDAAQVVEAVRIVQAGKRYVSESLMSDLLHQLMTDAPADPLATLSARERQVLQMLAEGNSVARTAEALSLSPKTVETYRSRLMGKLGLDNMVALVHFAARHGLVSFE
jgi:DNA-binding NarL/FixJ family response regulator